MTTESALKARLRETWRRAWDEGEVEALDDLVADDYERTTNGSERVLSAAEFKAEIVDTRRAFPDLTTTVTAVVEDGGTVAVFWTSTGTHRAELQGVPATRRSVTIHGSNLCHLDDEGRVRRELVTWDPSQLLDALGIQTVRHD
ncbi:ester cyclase [Kineococcus gynurae]|uniref:Ester cyclase n=1 Tax=Kineococcus gynurae TaxID=452979 RepID=A0ABV5LPE1_9ACTN